ncbi:hypothetical protein AMATHDRAFT_76200 [Amanita thiersii Skay4041]|uniref:Ribokinase n=1 Tax=Amanita thiersii Skay4041 TaxID=703135 RepID=A0A2A9NNZ7_9AGAR|nr:hypothetical protein AMATHDRAFT_76200 [Amanita thiersii Skay4041]
MALPSQTPCRCIVRGSINSDEYFYVTTISRPGETISSKGYQRRIGGKGANQAVAIARAGGNVDFYGAIGHDGVWIKEEMKNLGMNIQGLITSDDPTGRALIQVADNGENSIVLHPGANHSQLHEELFESDKQILPVVTHLLLQNEIHMRSNLYALDHAHGAISIMNPSPLPAASEIIKFPWHKIDWLVVNEGEAEDLLKSINGQVTSTWSSTEEMLRGLFALPPFQKTNIVCTLGAQGVLAAVRVNSAASIIFVPAAKLQNPVLDTTGAGDCFTGYFVRGLMAFGPDSWVGRGMTVLDVENILKTCVQAAGISVERSGTIDSIPFEDEVKERMK